MFSGIEGIPHRSPITSTSTTPTKIPKVIHQTWKSKNLSDYPVKNSYDDWKSAGYEVILWTDSMVEELVRDHYPNLYPTFKGYALNIQRADIARYVILYHSGGIYADLDCYRGFNDVKDLLDADMALPITDDKLSITNHFMVAAKGSPVLLYALENAYKHDKWIIVPYLRVFSSTGPLFITRMLREWIHLNQQNKLDLIFFGPSSCKVLLFTWFW